MSLVKLVRVIFLVLCVAIANTSLAQRELPDVRNHQLVLDEANTPQATLNPQCGCQLRLKVYPMPAHSTLTVEHAVRTGARLVVTDMLGREVLNTESPMMSTLDVSTWSKGRYHFRLVLGESFVYSAVSIWP